MVLRISTWTIPQFLLDKDEPSDGEWIEFRWTRWVPSVDKNGKPLGLVEITLLNWGY